MRSAPALFPIPPETGLISRDACRADMECILLATCGMPITRRRCSVAATIGLVSLFAGAAPLAAQATGQPDTAPSPHVRPMRDLRRLVEEAGQRSPSIRALLAQLEALDVTVYVRTRAFMRPDLEGRIALLTASGGHRYLVIELSCTRSTLVQMATLGHELFHAVEIATEPSILDAQTLAAFYGRVGMEIASSVERRTFETTAAIEAGTRARHELLANSGRSANGS